MKPSRLCRPSSWLRLISVPPRFRLLLCLLVPVGLGLSAGLMEGAEPIRLRAGPVTLLFEPDNAGVRHVNVGSHEILRGIIAPVRNKFWGTVLPVVSKVQVDDRGNRFSLSFEALCRERDIDFVWQGSIRGDTNGQVEFTFDGLARATFERNRIGFCVLHGPSAAGRPWKIETIHGRTNLGQFPEFISPHQPAKEIRAIAHEIAPNLWAHVRMEGDTFEMEDQRNWIDASFKTYCTPLEIPYPVRIPSGTRIAQKVTVRLDGPAPADALSPRPADSQPSLTLSRSESALPRLGLQVSSQTNQLSATEVQRLTALNLDHLRVDLTLTNETFPAALKHAAAQARALGISLHVGLRLGSQPAAAMQRLVTELESIRPPVALWLIIGADPAQHQLARNGLEQWRGKVGTAHEDVNFVQLNRVRPSPEMMDVVSYGATPQVHAFDNLSIMETPPILADTVRSARQFVGPRPLIIGPITLRLPTLSQPPLPHELPSDVDPRQRTAFTAAWTLASLKYLAETGVEAATYFETVGWKGIMEAEAGAFRPDLFPSRPGELFPVYHVLREVSEFKAERVLRVDESDRLTVAALALRRGNQIRMLIANLTDRRLSVGIRGFGGVQRAQELAVAPAQGSEAGNQVLLPRDLKSVDLRPYGVLQLEGRGEVP